MSNRHVHHSVGYGDCAECLEREMEREQLRQVLQLLVGVVNDDPGEQSKLTEQWKWGRRLEKALAAAKLLGIQ